MTDWNVDASKRIYRSYTEKVRRIYEELQTWDTELLEAIKTVKIESMAAEILEKDRVEA